MLKLLSITIAQSIFLCGAQILLKKAMAIMGKFSMTWAFFSNLMTNWYFITCGITFTIASVLWMYLLKHYPFSVAYPMSSMTYVFGMLSAMLIFHEHIAWTQWLGILLIMGGCVLIAR